LSFLPARSPPRRARDSSSWPAQKPGQHLQADRAAPFSPSLSHYSRAQFLPLQTVTVHTSRTNSVNPARPTCLRQGPRAGSEGDGLINNAGRRDGPFATSDLTTQRRMISVNIHRAHGAHPPVRARDAASGERSPPQRRVGGRTSARPQMSVYFSTKHYVLAFSGPLNEEMRGQRRHCHWFAPRRLRRVCPAGPHRLGNYMANTKGPLPRCPIWVPNDEARQAVAVYSLRLQIITGFLVRITPRFG